MMTKVSVQCVLESTGVDVVMLLLARRYSGLCDF